MITSTVAREILDSRGNPTVEVSMKTGRGVFVSSVPSGASTGTHEAIELRDGGYRYLGKGVLKAVDNINNIIAPVIKGTDPRNIDNLLLEMDGTKNKSSLGANAVLAVSMSAVRASAKEEGVSLYRYISLISERDPSLPRPCFNVINGGAHAGGGVDFQEFMIVPDKGSFIENLRSGSESYHRLKKRLKIRYGERSVNIGDEGGFVPSIKTVNEVLSFLKEITDSDIFIDVAASEFMNKDMYKIEGKEMTEEDMIFLYESIVNDFPVKGLEDPFGEDSFSSWRKINYRLGKKALIVGDDLLATNTERMKMAEKKEACNAMILKINQIGTIKEALEAVALAREFGWKIIVSHRSGETNDDFIADLAVGVGSEYIKTGAPARGERVAKYNRLSLIEREI